MCLQDTRCPHFSIFIPTSLPHILSELCDKQNSRTDGQMSVQRDMPTRGHLLGYFLCHFVPNKCVQIPKKRTK